MAKGIFNPDNDLWRITGKLVDLFLLSVFWLVCSIPLFTLGPATAALYHTVVRCIRGDGRDSWTLFFRTFRANFRVGALTSLVVLAAGAFLFFLYSLLYQTAAYSRAGYVLFMAYYVFLLLPLGLLCYLFPTLSRFELGVRGLLSNCAKLSIAHLPTTAALALLLYGTLYVCLNVPVAAAVLPAVLALAHSLLLERVFAPYMGGAEEGPEDGAP